MNKAILNTEIQEFINSKLNSDITALLFKKKINTPVDLKLLIEQIEAKKSCKKKLPTWFNTKHIYYPNKLNIEQTSSEQTAMYKSKLIKGNSILDLTGGFGVDSFHFANHFLNVTYCEIDKELSDIVKHNFKQFKLNNVEYLAADGVGYLKKIENKYDWIYVDPSRRHDKKGKVFFLSDCSPNLPEHLDLLFKHSRNVMVKTSPLLDISVGINELSGVKAIHIVAVNGEVKELLWILEKGYDESIKVITANIKAENTKYFEFELNHEKDAEANYSEPLSYLYEPNAAILKSGAFKLLSHQLKVFKLHPNTHLYTHEQKIDFPGRRFKIEKVLPYNKKLLKKEFIHKANITSRNFPESVHEIRRKLKLKDGGRYFLFVTTSITINKVIIICTKID